MDYEKALSIKQAIDRLRGIGQKINELVERKRVALERNDFGLAKKLKEEIDSIRRSVYNARLHFQESNWE